MSVFVLENLSKSFRVNKTDFKVLKNINIIFPDTGLVSIVGKSGSGKSTLLNILMGIERPTEGKVYFKGRDIRKMNDKRFSDYHLNEISLVFQHYNLFQDLTAFENIALPLKMKGEKRRKINEKVNKILNDLGIEKLAKQKCDKLSGGEKQRVAIGRALITNPSVILCDEPTGALDYQNSQEIMNILKEKSENLLIIMVSHNLDLVEKYSDFIVELKDGQIVNSSLQNRIIKDKKEDKKRTKYRGFWLTSFILKNLKKNILKNIFSLLACTLGFSAMFLCVGFTIGSEVSQNEALTKNLSIGYATISSIKTVDLEDSMLTYQKSTRPELFEIDNALSDIDNIVVGENFSYYLGTCPTVSFSDQNLSEFQMVPVYDLSLSNYGKDMLIAGSTGRNNFDEVIVNEEFMKLFKNLKVNDNLIFKSSSSVIFNTFDEENPFISDDLFIEKTLKIVGIIKEFPFLNSPKIYYSYQGAKGYLKSQIMENLSYFFGKRYSFYDYLEQAENDNEVTSYSSVIFLKNLDQKDIFFDKINELKGSDIEITSSALEIKDTYKLFISSFSKTLLVFVGIAFVGISLILGMISLSSFIENRKNTAILTCLGAKNSSIYKIYLIENYFLVGLSLIFSLFLSIFVQDLLNPIISVKFALTNLITIPFESLFEVKYFLILVLAFISVLLSTLFSVVPMSIYRNGFVSEELRDE